MHLHGSLSGLPKGAKALADGADKLLTAETELQTGVNTIKSETKKLSSGAKELYEGTKILQDGSNEMQKGLDTLKSGTSELTNANDQLNEGAKTLSDGADTLANGMNKFNKEGISKVCNAINGELKDTADKLEKMQELADKYENFTMINGEEANGKVKFVMLIDGIKAHETSKEEAILSDKNS